MEARLNGMEAALEEKTAELAELTEQLQRCKDYDDIKQELSVMKSIEFPASSNPHTIKDKSLEVRCFFVHPLSSLSPFPAPACRQECPVPAAPLTLSGPPHLRRRCCSWKRAARSSPRTCR